MKKKPQWLLLLLAICVSLVACSSVVNSAQRKTEREISKKANKKIEDVFKPKAQKKENPPVDPDLTASSGDQNPGTSTQTPPPEKLQTRTTDFVPGTKVIFADGPKGEQVGEFPSKWDLKSGSVEVMSFGENQVIGFLSKASIFPLMETKDYLPEKFTIEFDCYFHDRGNEGYYLDFNDRAYSVRINIENVDAGIAKQRTEVKHRKGWRHVELSFNKRALKIYFEGERLINIPRLKIKPTRLNFRALSFNSTKNQYAMIKNLRIAKGAVPLYDRLLTDGKIVTNDIHFDSNKASLKSQSMPIIEELVKIMLAHPELQLSVEGHTDSDGQEIFNLDLSQRRAAAVKAAMVKRGVASDRLLTKGHGENQPIDQNTTEDGKAKNRRVGFVKIND